MSYDIRLDDKYGSLQLIDLPAEIAAHESWFNQTLTTVNDLGARAEGKDRDPHGRECRRAADGRRMIVRAWRGRAADTHYEVALGR